AKHPSSVSSVGATGVPSTSARSEAMGQSAGEDSYPALPGTLLEAAAIARLFPKSRMLLKSEASEQALDELATSGQLGGYRFLHFATHADMDRYRAMQSRLILARDRLPNPLTQVLAGRNA